MTVIVVDDYSPMRGIIVTFLLENTDLEIVAQAENGKEAIGLCKKYNPDMVITDIEMPELNGIKATKKILEYDNNIKILAVTMHKNKIHLEELIKAGFKGCVFKDNIFEELPKAIDAVISGQYYFPKNINL